MQKQMYAVTKFQTDRYKECWTTWEMLLDIYDLLINKKKLTRAPHRISAQGLGDID